jgi:hypothetical protein
VLYKVGVSLVMAPNGNSRGEVENVLGPPAFCFF